MQLILSDSSSSAIFWSLVLVGLIVVGFVVVLRVKRWVNAPDTSSGGGFTLSDLRRMHKEGRMTDAEFEKAKTLIIGVAKAPRTDDASELKPPPGRSPQL
jgi:hypothetical protein